MVQVLSVVAGVVISVLSFNGAREAEARALQADAEKREVEAAKSFLDLRQRLYLDVLQQAAVLSNPEVHSSQERLAAKKRFRLLSSIGELRGRFVIDCGRGPNLQHASGRSGEEPNSLPPRAHEFMRRARNDIDHECSEQRHRLHAPEAIP